MTSTAARNHPPLMTVEEFIKWPGDGTGTRYELVNGELRAQDATTVAHGTIHTNLTILIGNHLRSNRPGCLLVVAPGVQPRLRAHWNFCIPDLGVTCSASTPKDRTLPEPVLLIEILSESNSDDTWSNIALYATLPSVAEILIVDSTKVAIELLRRGADGSWPQAPQAFEAGAQVALASIGFEFPVRAIYRDTYLEE